MYSFLVVTHILSMPRGDNKNRQDLFLYTEVPGYYSVTPGSFGWFGDS